MEKTRPDFIGHYSTFEEKTSFSYPGSTETHSIGSPVGRMLGLKSIGIHHELLPPGIRTSWPHAEKTEEEFAFVLEGNPDVWINGELYPLTPGDFVAFPAGTGIAHTFMNNTILPVRMLVGGNSSKEDNQIYYPLHPKRNQEMKNKNAFWENHPTQIMGSHDGIPQVIKPEWTKPITLRNNLYLKVFELKDASELFSVIDQNRQYLSQFLQWPRKTNLVSDSEEFIMFVLKQAMNGIFNYGIFFENKLVGVCGYNHIDKQNLKTSLGYWLAENAQGKGLMADSVNYLIKNAFENLKLNRIEILCSTLNLKSAKIAKKLGFELEGTLRKNEIVGDKVYDHFIFSKIRD